jgi:ABC-2 type transport system permease protein
MTTSLAPRTSGIDDAVSAVRPISFARLVRVEWTKATDTRAARWLLALVGLSTAGIMLAPIVAPTRFDQTYAGYLEVASIPQVILIPVVGLLMLTGEWSHRSIMTTFTQEPRRLRVVGAKVSASLMLGCGAALFGGLATIAGLGLAAASGRTLEGALSFGDIGGYLLYLLLNVLGGVAVGALLHSSATAITAYFAVNMAVALLGAASTLIADWVDTSTTWNWIIGNEWGGHVPQITVSVLIWIVIPLAAGVVRTMRRDVG